MSRAEFGSALGVSFETVKKWETGERFPRASTRKLIELKFRPGKNEVEK